MFSDTVLVTMALIVGWRYSQITSKTSNAIVSHVKSHEFNTTAVSTMIFPTKTDAGGIDFKETKPLSSTEIDARIAVTISRLEGIAKRCEVARSAFRFSGDPQGNCIARVVIWPPSANEELGFLHEWQARESNFSLKEREYLAVDVFRMRKDFFSQSALPRIVIVQRVISSEHTEDVRYWDITSTSPESFVMLDFGELRDQLDPGTPWFDGKGHAVGRYSHLVKLQ